MKCGYDPLFLYTSYGQRTENKEFESAQKLAEVVDTDMDTEEMPMSYVPSRNANLLLMTTSFTRRHTGLRPSLSAHTRKASPAPPTVIQTSLRHSSR